jgi:alanine racemase
VSASNPIPTARAWADVDLGALVANARTVLSVSGSRLLPMVKANAYGLGAVPVARALDALDPWGFGVATVEEGVELRRAGIRRPVVVFSPLGAAAIEACLREDLRPVLGDVEGLRRWIAAGDRPFHVEIDTGMARLGFRWSDAAALRAAGRLLDAAAGWEGVFTHFHSADFDDRSVQQQWERLNGVVAGLPRRPAMVHAANSAAALRGRAFAGDLVRPGIFLYGGAAGRAAPSPRTVLRFRAPVVASRRIEAGDSVSYGASWRAPRATTIVTVAAGYADGLPRALSDAGSVELAGRVYPMVGRVTMDFVMVDVGRDEVPPGTIATLYGGAVSLEAQAAAAHTINYELLTGLGARVPRRYEEGP